MRRPKPFIYEIYENPLSGGAIEERSFEIIDEEIGEHRFSDREWDVARRMIHTVGDFAIADTLRFSENAIDAGIAALRACSTIYTDSNMIRTGLSTARLKSACSDYEPDRIVCYVADPKVVGAAEHASQPRSLFAVKKAKPALHGGIAVFGNAPVGLLELNRMIIEDDVRPALVVAMPVGFVHVTESKEELMSLEIPFIALEGRRGGSPLAVSVIHALCALAARERDEE